MTESKLTRSINDAAMAVRQESCSHHDTLWRAYVEIEHLLFALVTQGAIDASTTEAQARCISLTANLVQSSIVVANLVSEGFYWSAGAVLRQRMETLARIIEIRTGRRPGRTNTPNVGVLPYRLSRNYGRLSELVHVSGGELLADFAEGREGPEVATAQPRYRQSWAKGLLCLDIAQMVVLAQEIDLLHRRIYPGRDLIDTNTTVIAVACALVDIGFWEAIDGCEGPDTVAGYGINPRRR